MDNNYLFLAMQTGGQLSPEQLQRAQQMGQLPQMNMGAGLNDIQKKNMAEAQHYNMFRKGGVPKRYAQGGEQEEIDQEYLSPYTQYNQRVSDFLQNLRSTSMNALQDEMVGVNDDYAQETDQIEMEQAQYGQQVSQSSVNPQGLAAANAWAQAAQNTKDLTQPLAQTASLASGLKGYWGDQAAYEANPYNSKWNPTRLTITNNQTGEKTVTRAKRDRSMSQPMPISTQAPANTNDQECTPGTDCFPDTFDYGGQYLQPGGPVGRATPSTWEQQLFQGIPMYKPQAPFQKGTGQLYVVPNANQTTPANVLTRPDGEAYNAETIANAKVRGWGDDLRGYEASGWVQKPGTTAPDLPTSLGKKKEKAPAPAAPPAATTTTPPATTVQKTEDEKKKEEANAKDKDKTTTETKTDGAETPQPKTGTGEIDYLAMLADPTGQNAGGVYRTDRNGNPVPMAFYDPNMRLTGMSADYRNNVASWFRKNKRPGQMKSVSFDFGSSTPYTVPGAPAANNNLPPEGTQVVTNPDGTESSISPEEAARRQQIAMGMPEGTSTITNPDGTQSSVAPDFYERNFPAPNVPTWDPSQFIPKYNAPSPPAIAPQAPQQPTAPQPMSPGAAWNPQDFLPTSLRTAQQAPLTAEQQRLLNKINQGTKGKRKGGQYFQPGGENPEGIGVLSNPVDPTPNTNFFETGLLPQPEQSNYMSPALPGETVMEQNKSFTAKYDKNKKDNPFFAPAALAGLNLLAGAAENMDAKKKEKEARGKFSYDQIYSANPETSGSRGDWTFNEGYMRPNDMVPTQFTGAGAQMQWGGAYSEGDELYLDEDAIQAFLAAGGQLDYLD